MANSKRTLFLKRRLRVRNKLRKVNAGRLRLSVHRSNKNISVQLIDDVKGVTLAAASTLEKDLGFVGSGNQSGFRDRRARESGWRDRSILRSWRFPLSWQSEGSGRRCA